MAEKTTTKRINLYQLGQEMGFPELRLTGDGTATTSKTVWSSVTQTALDTAVAAHSYNAAITAPADPAVANAGAIASALTTAGDRLHQIITQQQTISAAAKDATTTGQVGQLWTATKAQADALADMALMLNRLRRLVQGDFTGTD